MSFTVLTKKIQDNPITSFLDQQWVMWICADDVLQVLRLPAATLQSVPLRHKKCWHDFKCPDTSCRFDGNRIFINLYALGCLCNRVSSNSSDYLCTLFVAEVYRELCLQQQPSSQQRAHHHHQHVVPLSPPSPDTRKCDDHECTPECGKCGHNNHCDHDHHCDHNHHHHHHHNHNRELLECIGKQNDLIINGLGQLCVNNSNQHLEITNVLHCIKLQNITLNGQLSQLIDSIDNQLSSISDDVLKLLNDFDEKFDKLLGDINRILAQLQDTLRNELTGINSILNNLTSSVTNINSTLNNILQSLNGLNLGELLARFDEISSKLDEILGLLTIDIPLNSKERFIKKQKL
ncbi:pep [Hemileuca sp. nucleopolyhedrovirus]|uniref:Pep n=1 Tax=Hemileuca sp. nucleopolyhedrovirus TaxID=1367203 RepID=S5MQB2_9ABAC|nr:pep [Hemileuca sp. nucleopolyhedrovirus]AGR56858.1 pep [Hemileuca sp. nucleopolyhedrovirus]